jgi:hypothetical protein
VLTEFVIHLAIVNTIITEMIPVLLLTVTILLADRDEHQDVEVSSAAGIAPACPLRA